MPLLQRRAFRTLKHFLLELLVFTVGLLITLGVNWILEWRQHQQLAAEARASIRAEIARNLGVLDQGLQEFRSAKDNIQTSLDALEQFERMNRTGKIGGSGIEVEIDFDDDLYDISWKSAHSTGALSHMPYDEVQRYEDIYTIQQDVNDTAKALLDDTFMLLAALRSVNQVDEKSGRLILTHAKATELIKSFRTLQTRLSRLSAVGGALKQKQQNFLEGRNTKVSVRESAGRSGRSKQQ